MLKIRNNFSRIKNLAQIIFLLRAVENQLNKLEKKMTIKFGNLKILILKFLIFFKVKVYYYYYKVNNESSL